MRKKQKAEKMPLRRMIINNLYMLKIIHKIDPWIVPLRIMVSIAGSVTKFLSSAYILRYSLNAVSEGKSFYDVLGLIILLLSADLLISLMLNAFWHLYYNRKSIDISKK